MSRPRDHWPSTSRSLNMGFELAAALAGFCLLGYWIDVRYDTAPWGLLICACLGLIGGMYNLIRTALAVTGGRRPESRKRGPAPGESERSEKGDRGSPPSSG
ncbi:MAG: AtpZ/AtpI family protein [Phycisphaerae bacterium]|nr:AtpZ/AtpI family protein [Phycisphaerae bacterium]